MDFRVALKEKYSKMVWTHGEMDELRKAQCLCLHCQKLSSCMMARTLFELCQPHNVAMAITRCPNWEAPEKLVWK